jgi:hypothetical protein
MENISNGKKQGTGRGCHKRICQDEPVRLGTSGHNSPINGTEEPGGSFEVNSTGKNFDWKLTPIRDTTAGKILERLNALEKSTLTYIHSHQNRLKARLEESEQTEQQFIEEANQIKSDIYHLAVAQQNSNGNGHQ